MPARRVCGPRIRHGVSPLERHEHLARATGPSRRKMVRRCQRHSPHGVSERTGPPGSRGP
jgi:hypothetical protein